MLEVSKKDIKKIIADIDSQKNKGVINTDAINDAAKKVLD